MRGHMTRRQMLRGLSLMAGASVLGACAPAGTQQVVKETVVVQASPQVIKETVVVETIITPTPVGGPEATVRVFDYDPTGNDVWVEADKAFGIYFNAKYPHIRIMRDQAPWTGFTEKLLTSIAGGAKYDVIYGYWEWLPLFRENDIVSPLDPLIDADPEIDADSFYDYAKEVVEGKIYGLSWYASSWFFWLNKTRIQEVGLDEPKELDKAGKWDYLTFYEYAKQLTRDEGDTRYYGTDLTQFAWRDSVFSIFSWNWGSDLWNEDFSQCTINSPENIEAMTYIQRFFLERLTPTLGETLPEGIGHWYVGRAYTFLADVPVTRQAVHAKTPSLFDIGMVRVPKGPKAQQSIVMINSFYLGKEPQYPEAAWIWYKERSFSEAANKIYAAIGGGRFPCLKGLEPQVTYPFEDPEVYDMIRPTLRWFRTPPKAAEFTSMYRTAFEEVIMQTRPVKEVLDELAANATELMKS